jgi:hypothetical protein
MGTHRCKTPEAAHLYNSPSTRVNDLVILAMRLASDQSEDPSNVLVSRVLHAGAGSVSMASASSAPHPSSKESTNASFDGFSSMGSVPVGFEGAPKGSS